MTAIAGLGRASGTRRRPLAEYALVATTLVEIAVFAALAPQFFSLGNAVNIAQSIAVTGILAAGMTAVILTGGIDLSVGSVVALAGVAAAMTAAASGSVALALLAALGVGLAVGVVNGLLVTLLGVPAFIATLATMTAARGLAFLVSGGRSVGDLPSAFGALGRATPLGIPATVYVMAAVLLATAVVLRRTVVGRYVYAVGGNPQASWMAGVPTRRVTRLVYGASGVLAGLGGFVLASRLAAGVPNSGVQYELDVIAAVVVGGTSLSGGRGSIAGTLWGAVFIGVLTNGLNLSDVDTYVQKIALGAVIVIAVVLDQLGRKRAAW